MKAVDDNISDVTGSRIANCDAMLENAVEMAMGGKWPYGYEEWGWPQ